MLELQFLKVRFSGLPRPQYHTTQRPQSSFFLGLPYRILNMNTKKELLWGVWVEYPVLLKEHKGSSRKKLNSGALGARVSGFTSPRPDSFKVK